MLLNELCPHISSCGY